MPDDAHKRYALLNHIVSRSTTRAHGDVAAPVHSVGDLIAILEQRISRELAFEYPRGVDGADDAARRSLNTQRTLIRITDARHDVENGFDHVTLLFEHVDVDRAAFPVVHTTTFAGRELTGQAAERGAAAAHMVIRLPAAGTYDDGKCRCALEAVPGLARRSVEWLMSRQIRRVSDEAGWDFDDPRRPRKGRKLAARLRYTPKLELHADVGRPSGVGGRASRTLSSMMFTKRSERLNVAQGTDVENDDFNAAVTIKIRAEQGPNDPALLTRWATTIRKHYETSGYTTRLAFRHAGGDIEQGTVNAAIDGATDLLLCSRELVDYGSVPKLWLPGIDTTVAGALRAVCNRDEIWPPPHQR